VEAARDAGLDAGALAFLEKPVSQSRLWDTVVKLLFPKSEQRSAQLAANPQPNASPELKMHVLLVEDSEINQQIAIEVLAHMGVETTVVNNGSEALDLLLATPDPLPWSMVFMDLQMPVMDGHQATIAIRKISRFDSLPIMAMTAHAMQEEGQRCLEEDMNEHLTKPIEPDALLASLRRWGRVRDDLHSESKPVDNTDTLLAQAVEPLTPTVDLWRNIPGINSQNGLRNCGNKEPLYVDLLRKYALALRRSVDQLNSACEQSDWVLGRRVIHTIKGTSLNLGADDCAQLCMDAEKLLRSDTDTRHWLHRSQQLSAVFLQLTFDITQRLDLEGTVAEVPTQPYEASAELEGDAIHRLEGLLRSGSEEAEAFCTNNQSLLRQALGPTFDEVYMLTRDYEFERALDMVMLAQQSCETVA
jgi:CheY-like chemotaxis protein